MIPLDEVVHFDVTTRSAAGVTDADSVPTFSVYEEDTDTAILGPTNMTKRTALTGNYRGSFTQSAANGFEVGKWYNLIATGIVGGITDKTVVLTWRCGEAEAVTGRSQAHVAGMSANTLTASALATDAVTEIQSGLASQASVDTIDDFLDTEIAAIKAKTDQLTFTIANQVDANALTGGGSPPRMSRAVNCIGLGTVDSGATISSIPTSSLDPAAVAINQFKGRIMTFAYDTTTAALRGQSTDIRANTAGGVFTVTNLTDAPVAGDIFTIQ